MKTPTPRRSTWVFAAVFVVTGVLYVFVRPAPAPDRPNSPVPVFIVPTTQPEPVGSVPVTTIVAPTTVPVPSDLPVPPTSPPAAPPTSPPAAPTTVTTTIDPATEPPTTPAATPAGTLAASSPSQDTIVDAGGLLGDGFG